MRLLKWNDQAEFVLTKDLVDNIPPYAILSHTWGSDDDEFDFTDVQQRQGRSKVGYTKIRFCGEQARRDGIEHFWVDTCCINKDNQNELSEAITSMFRWYRNATKCYVYLSDVSVGPGPGPVTDTNGGSGARTWESSLRKSRWFTRGWTLQELLAPSRVDFYSREGDLLGTKVTLAQYIHEITTIPLAAIHGTALTQFPVNERMRWTEQRRTTKTEDRAYCLLGIFGVFMPLLYGEGDHAFWRLKKEIREQLGANVVGGGGGGGGATTARHGEGNNALDMLLKEINNQLDDDNAAHLGVYEQKLQDNVQASQPDKLRPMKRARLFHAASIPGASPAYPCNNMIVSGPCMESIGDYVQRQGQDSRHDPKINKADKYTILLKSLQFDRMNFRVTFVRKALLSTCQWLFCHSHFQTWYKKAGSDQHSSFLWIKGKPGCGKSTLMKAALEWARRRNGKVHPQVIVPYFFNARASTPLEKSSLGLYRTIVYHLLSSCPSIRPLFTEKFALKNPEQPRESWTVEELQDFLCDAIELNEPLRLCLFIDALDEAEYENDVRQMISFLIELSDRASIQGSSALQVCLSSRHYPHITIGRGLSLTIEDQPEHSHDIETYIIKELTCTDDIKKDGLRSKILDKSAGVFLWVVLVVRILNKLEDQGAPLTDMEDRLEILPTDLNDLFREILTKNDRGIESSMLLFQWMLFRIRPLEPTELFVAMEYSRSPDVIWAPTTRIPAQSPGCIVKYIIDCSRGLVEIVESGPSQTVVVQFIHETVRQFLLNQKGLAMISPALATSLTGISHETLRIACLRRLSAAGAPKEYERYCELSHQSRLSLEKVKSDLRLKSPFLDYAILHLFDHAELAQENSIPQTAFLLYHFKPNGLWLTSHRMWWNVLERTKCKKFSPDASSIQFVIERQHSNLLSGLLSAMNTEDICCRGYKSLLQFASFCGSAKVIQMLLDRGADVNAQGPDGTAIYTASEYGRNEALQILIDAGANVNAQGGHYGTALQAASEYGNSKAVQILVDSGADINAHSVPYGTALQATSFRGRKNLTQILLSMGADVNAHGGQYGTALQAASVNGHDHIVQMLIDAGAEINARAGPHGTALEAASKHCHLEVVELLRKHGAEPELTPSVDTVHS